MNSTILLQRQLPSFDELVLFEVTDSACPSVIPIVQIFYLSNIYGMSEYGGGRRGHWVNSLVSVVALVLQVGDVLVAQQIREVGDDNRPTLRLQRRHYHRRSRRLSKTLM